MLTSDLNPLMFLPLLNLFVKSVWKDDGGGEENVDEDGGDYGN